MAKYIKSYSTYVLDTKHQTTKDGAIFSKDISTVDTVGNTSNGQVPVYKSGNFVITTNNDYADYKKISDRDWHRNDEGEVWTLNTLKNYDKDEKSSDDKKIVIKKDYYDLRDFAYYGSCSELMRTSIEDILKHYPGEMIVPCETLYMHGNDVQYTEQAAIDAWGEGNYETSRVGIYGYYTSYEDSSDHDEHTETELGLSHKELIELIGQDKDIVMIDNPFGIDMHSDYVPEGADPLRYFANGGISNYVGYLKDGDEWDFDYEYTLSISGTEGIIDKGCLKPGDFGGSFVINFHKTYSEFKVNPLTVNLPEAGGTNSATVISYVEDELAEYSFDIFLFMCDDGKVKYFVDKNAVSEGRSIFDFRIRPKKEIIEYFFDSLSSFEKVLLNRDSDIPYTADFELIGENENGMYTYTRSFTFPTTYGGYNLGSNNQSFKEYVSSLSEVGEYYDSIFTDNLWRSMTHEAIKNFDWTYTRKYTDEEEIPFIEGGSKIQKIIRVYGREFDEIKSYIDAIDDSYTVTYDNVNNLPDYFFTDKLEEYGWDVKLVHPLVLSEFVNNHMSVPIEIENEQFFPCKYDDDGNKITTEQAEQMNYFYDELPTSETRTKITIQRVFNQDFSSLVAKPYSCDNIVDADNATCAACRYAAQTDGSQTIDDGEIDGPIGGQIDGGGSHVIDDGTYVPTRGAKNAKAGTNDCQTGVDAKIYCDENEYSSADVNSEFLKRLIINSKSLWAHKGTIDGIEMLLAMFGLRSKNRVYSDERYFISKMTGTSTASTTCLSFTEEGCKYYNKYNCKTRQLYDYDIKEYTLFTTNIEDEWDAEKNMYVHDWINSTKLSINDEDYSPYQGLPVSYSAGTKTVNGEDIKIRQLYPHFDSYERYDGNPYYQMKGGWMHKYPFMFDSKNNILMSKDVDNSLFTETVKNIKCVNTLHELLSNYSLADKNGDICQVLDLSGRYAIIDGYPYDIYTERYDNESYDYIYATITNNSLSLGNAFFTDYVIVSNPFESNNRQKIMLSNDYNNDREIKIYIIDGKVEAYSKEASISTVTIFENGKYMEGDNYTNYFVINNIDYATELSVLGWRQLKDDEYDYYKIDTVVDEREGNNPHTGHLNYDNGHEYLTYFKHLFKNSYENDAFDYRKYEEGDLSKLDGIYDYGFSNLISGDCEINYDKYLREDSKCHYFGNMISLPNRGNLSCFRNININNTGATDYTLTQVVRKNRFKDIYDGPVPAGSSADSVKQSIERLMYGYVSGSKKDANFNKITKVTDQIVNTKRIDIEFYINNRATDENRPKMYSKEWLEEVKYIDSVILPYLSQMIPSNVICGIKYLTRNSQKWDDKCKS